MSQSEQPITTLSDHRKSLQDLKKSYEESKEPEKQQIGEIITYELHDILKKYSLDFSKEQMKIFNDPIHGHMELHPLLVKIIDTPQFQRLRHIKQLGGKYLVYPGASHNRFEHSIGVAYLAGRLVKSLHNNQSELKITKQDFLCVQIAGLCHDLGHGPASHVFDNLFIPEAKKIKKSKGLPDDIPENWKHEQMSVLLFDDIVKSLKAENEDVLNEHGLDDKDVTFIKELIEGAKMSEWTYEGRDEDKSYLYEIVANKQNGIDVDKWDYFARDCHHLGIRNSFDHLRLLKFARVCKVNERNHICFRDKEADNVYEMFRTRYTLHRQAYQHKIANIIEDMLAEALVRADRDLHEGKPKDMLMISEAIKTAEDYSKLTDEIFEKILSSTADNLREARDILIKIVRRKLPKFVGEARLTQKNTSKEELTETWKTAVEKYKPTDPTISLNAEDFSVYVVDLDHGMKDKNPIEYVYFYSKRKPNEAFPIKDYQLSSFLPKRFNEELVRVYCKRSDGNEEEEKKKVEEAEKCFQIWCNSKFGLH
ncbi:hypothetical protein Q8A67_005330 [Cirrhinus molitorella]|uniref:HD domain-containing protein n=1 Tax=Cirrhinus molitorella TaxID=172907 RepID=A0AA88QDA3_9TELE|nr:hypothetical protein Q8A67_005330 [Cirrhinus molitorella]